MKQRIVTLLMLALCINLFAQTKPQWINYYSRRNIKCIVPDGNTMWIGTKGGGVYQSDLNGNVLQSFTKVNGLANNIVNSIAIDTLGNKWFGTWSGVSKFDGTNLTTYTTAGRWLGG